MTSEILITKFYRKDEPSKDLDFEFDTRHPGKPHWILIKNIKDRPRFLSVKTSKNSELIYKAFGNFYYPIEHLPTQEVQKSLMQVVARKYDEIVGDLNIKIANFIFDMVKELNLPKEINILDLGAGTGLTSEPFAKAGYNNITMVDVSKEMAKVALGKEIFKDSRYIVQDARRLDLPKKYDLVISGMFLCDLNDVDLEKAFETLVGYLNKNAYLALVEDERRDVYYKYFEPVSTGTHPFGEYTKYYFVGRLK